MFELEGTYEGTKVTFAWIGPGTWESSTSFQRACESMANGDEQVGLTPEGPFYDSGFDTEAQAYATVRSLIDGGVPTSLVGGPVIPSTKEGSDSSIDDAGISAPSL